jgi:hypothetical protein
LVVWQNAAVASASIRVASGCNGVYEGVRANLTSGA